MADDVDRAEDLSRAERETGTARAQAAISATGSPDCVECGDELSPERRKAAPFALRCIACQRRKEKTNAV